MRTALLTAAVICGVLSVGLLFGWGFLIFDDREWRQHGTAWLAWAVTLFVASAHPLTVRIDRILDGRASDHL